jgi:hypothetical protein
MRLTKEQWKERFLELPRADQGDLQSDLARKLERFGGEVPPREDLAPVDYARLLYERSRDAKKRHDAAMDEMVTVHEDGAYTLKGEHSLPSRPLDLWVDKDFQALALCTGDDVAYFTRAEVPRVVAIMKDLAEQLEPKDRSASEEGP